MNEWHSLANSDLDPYAVDTQDLRRQPDFVPQVAGYHDNGTYLCQSWVSSGVQFLRFEFLVSGFS